jgi:hypothetical protein
MNQFRKLPLFFVFLVVFSSCNKDRNESIQSAQDNAAIETEYSEIYDVVTDYVSNDHRTGKTDDYILASGAEVWFNDTTFTDGDGVDLTLDYGRLENGSGSKGVVCKDGRYRAGKIHVSMDKRWTESPTINVSIASSDEYYVGNGTKMYKVTGLKTITRTSATAYSVEVTNATMQRDNGSVSWNSSRAVNLSYDAGQGWYNDEYEISGSASGTNANGVTFMATTQTPLKKRLSLGCISTFISGKLIVTNSNDKMLEVNYDSYNNEACDKAVTVTYNGKSSVVQVW